ncbi:MAG: FHA domain-containing protein [Amphritea sp.]
MLKLQFKDNRQQPIGITGSTLTIGQDDNNELVIADLGVSDFHAEITTEGDSIYLVDLLSGKGTFVNDQRVSKRHKLKAWDVIKIASIELEVIDPASCRPTDWALQGELESLSGQLFPIQGALMVGREPDCDLMVSDKLLSRHHARLWIEDGELKVEDLASANGTFLNGERITMAVAKPGDEIRFDTATFRVIGPQVESQADGNKTQVRFVVDPDATIIHAAAMGHEELTDPNFVATQMILINRAHLVGTSEPIKESRFDLIKECSLLGRSQESDILLMESSVSGQHAEIYRAGNDWKIKDLNSTNGTYLNEQKVTTATLKDSDCLRMGRVELRFVDDEEADKTKPIHTAYSDAGPSDAHKVSISSIAVWIYAVIGVLLLLAGGLVFSVMTGGWPNE